MLIPYRKENAEYVYQWQVIEDYKRFFRNFSRYLTLEECERLPDIMNAEVLGFYTDDGNGLDFVGLLTIAKFYHGVAETGILIDKKRHGEKLALQMMKEAEAYLKKCGFHKFMAKVDENDLHTIRITENFGCIKDCILEKHSKLNGEFINEIQYHKFI